MSLWTTIRDVAESPFTIAGGVATGIASKLFGGGDSGNDDQRKLINDQIKAYQEQTALTRQQLDATRAQQDIEKRRVEQKQIRALRSNYRSAGLGAGLLGGSTTATPDMDSKLGGS